MRQGELSEEAAPRQNVSGKTARLGASGGGHTTVCSNNIGEPLTGSQGVTAKGETRESACRISAPPL